MAAGAFGVSCGLQWAPGFFSETDELIELGKVVGDFGGFMAFHMRSEGDKLLEAVAEVICIGEKAGVPVQISHLKAAGKHNFGKVHAALKLVEAARNRGVDVLVDTQPYGAVDRKYAAENMWIRSCIQPWIVAKWGGFANLRAHLGEPAVREEIKRDVEDRVSPHWRTRIVDCLFHVAGWDGLVLGSSESERFKSYVGWSIGDIAKHRGIDPYEAYFDIVQDEEIASNGLYFMMDPDDVRAVVVSPYTIPQVDAAPRHTHPRKHACFVHYLINYANNGTPLLLEEAVRKITSFPAMRMGLPDRGIVREGYWADLCVLDPNGLRDESDFRDNTRSPSGIDHVLVNGEFVVRHGRHTGSRPGKVLRRT
jgi:N-acyl-D-amino-acid deacylase